MTVQKKTKNCAVCGDEFYPHNSLAKICPTINCAILHANGAKAKREEKQEKAFNAETRQRKKEINHNDRKWLTKEVQKHFNRFIRLRDAGRPCIVCGTHGGSFDAGHFLGTGSHPELRFNEFNCHAEHSSCNRGISRSKITERTHDQRYEEGLRARIGDSLVDWLKSINEPALYTIDELQWLLCHYKEQCKMLELAT